jgi:predicted transglutaminase-like cysteine proteinase
MNKIDAVEKVNSLFEYELDKEQYNAADYWRVLDVNAEKDQGDCEDYALTVGWLLAGQSRLKFLWMLMTGKIKICYITANGGGHAVLEHEHMMVDNWKRTWTHQSTYEKDYAQYSWTFKYYYHWTMVVKKLIQGKFWKKNG